MNHSGIGRLFSNGIWLGMLFSAFAIALTSVLAPAIFASALHDAHIRKRHCPLSASVSGDCLS
ncbi:hypothetical protein MKQ70_02115 [Chitinophaga sedimenti]|uniref:hypothetical protein n=1 Tax=Chitinophaga sedimenti TaxID=2033606 RepID=UPI0020060827|nr:hypothetical protein [Chitinophaga sedimenti]MCK7553864.1 hypothetical protein [Chitinophaga sedimenti]